MSDQIAPPAPGPSGYQPAAGEGLTYVDVEVRPSRHYQTVGVSGRVVFPTPRSYTDALPAIEDAYQALAEYANLKVDELAEAKQGAGATAPALAPAAPAPQPQPQQPSPGQLVEQQLGGQQIAQQQGGMVWLQGSKPNNRGTFRYLASSSFAADRFKRDAVQLIAQLGVPSDQVVVFDDRTGQYGLESGNTAYSAGKVKASKDSQLKQAMGQRDIVGYVDFTDAGQIEVSLTKEGKAAVQALQMARQMQQPQQPAGQPPQAPPPTDADLPF